MPNDELVGWLVGWLVGITHRYWINLARSMHNHDVHGLSIYTSMYLHRR